jgi:hypothetical protein
MARTKASMTKRSRARAPSESRTAVQSSRELASLREAFADFQDITIAEPAVKPSGDVSRAIRKAVRDYYANLYARERG